MKLQTKIPLTKATNQIDYNSQLLLLGSCFSENIGDKMEFFKFQSIQNPFGILFHPLAIEKLISKALQKEWFTENNIFYLNERWHCFDAHSDLSDVAKESLLEKLNAALRLTLTQITKATHIIITLGTAWVYRKTDSDTIVANCHKVAQKEFSKELLSVDSVQNSLGRIVEMIAAVNQNVNFIFTVSPVRHLKDGFVENQRSKAHLATAIHNLIDTLHLKPSSSYFPSYELMIDELRDYRFYKADMIHPNQLSIDYIFEKFKQVWISDSANDTMHKVEEIQKGLAHQPFNPSGEQHQKFLKSLDKKITYLQQEYGFMKFDS